MFPGINPKQMRQAMKKLGMRQEEVDALQVIIRTKSEELIFNNPQVSKIDMMGQKTYQIVGEPEVKSIETMPEVLEEDLDAVMKQTGVDKEKALEAIKKHKGNLAEAILELTQ